MHCTVREEVNRFPQQKQECFNSPLRLQFLLTAQIAAAHSGGCGISQNRPGYPTRGGSPVGRRGPCGPMGPGPRCHPPATLPDFNSPRGPLPALLRPGRNSGGLFFRTDWARGAHGVAVPLQQVASGGIGLGGTGRHTPQFSPLLTPQPAAARPDTFPHSSPISPPKITPPPQNNNNKNPTAKEAHVTCQSPILARMDILAADCVSPDPLWSWTATYPQRLWVNPPLTCAGILSPGHKELGAPCLRLRATCALPARCPPPPRSPRAAPGRGGDGQAPCPSIPPLPGGAAGSLGGEFLTATVIITITGLQ